MKTRRRLCVRRNRCGNWDVGYWIHSPARLSNDRFHIFGSYATYSEAVKLWILTMQKYPCEYR